MRKHYLKLMPVGILAAALLAGCGGDSSGSGPVGGGGGGSGGPVALTPAPDLSQSVSALYAYMVALIASTSDSSSPVDINGTELAVDNSNEGTPLN